LIIRHGNPQTPLLSGLELRNELFRNKALLQSIVFEQAILLDLLVFGDGWVERVALEVVLIGRLELEEMLGGLELLCEGVFGGVDRV
jgi:hypothetical protein